MWLVLAHDGDVTARELVRSWPDATRLVSPADVCRDGWSLRMTARGSDVACAVAPAADLAEVAGVLTRLSVLDVRDVPAVHHEDRPYAAAELGAFLLAWLDACPVPVVNRPRPGCLNGPPWSRELWAAAAAEAGLPVATAPSSVAENLTVVGRQVLGEADPLLAAAVLRLAELAGTFLLDVTVDEKSRFVAATARPRLDSAEQRVLAETLGWTSC
jgi:hypothetical protein